MDSYLKRRLANPVFSGSLSTAARHSEASLYQQCAEQTQAHAKAHPLHAVRYNAAKCWEGYERVPGTAEYADDSCRKKGGGGKKKKTKKKSDKKKVAKKEGGSSSSSSSSDDEDGKPKAKKAKKGDD